MYEYNAEVTKHVDGDSIHLRVDLGFRLSFEDNFRVYGINTPELRDRDPSQKEKAQLAKARLAELCPIGSKVLIHTHKSGKYGRWLVTIYADGQDVGIILVNEGHAEEYFGGRR
jgi:micrococcal nuclease